MISCRNLTRRFGDFVAVDRVTFDVPKGTISALLGPNGAGKSTTLQMLAGLLDPSDGDATVAGRNPASAGLEFRRSLGVVPEGLGLFDDLTIEEHLLLTGGVYGLSRQEILKRQDELLNQLELFDQRHSFASACSFGMRKKTALAMALLPRPEVLLLDEPFEAIDPLGAITIQALLSGIAVQGATILISSHTLSVVERLAQHVLIMKAGRIIWQSPAGAFAGPLEDVYVSQVSGKGNVQLCADSARL